MSKKIIILIIISLVGGLYLFTKEQRKWFWTTEVLFEQALFPRGEASKEEVVATYLESLTQRNAKKISKLINPNFTADKEIITKIDEIGGHVFKDVTVVYETPDPDFAQFWFRAHITGKTVAPSGTELPFDEIIRVDMFAPDGRFYLIMGEPKYPLPEGIMLDEYATTSTLDTEQNMEEHLE